ncbi:hypothetical protein Poly30_35160 [Planctomycetes bacterium Poly30]|uniref:DUF1565 domain-containing protein n=1 Tax=Saltatorellus ferox TaxID=2528018 RepID=A0A518EV61_9BACT|nr:hypothetical protein Poly30_35160 [Planctomycetes bacterium Poly30]
MTASLYCLRLLLLAPLFPAASAQSLFVDDDAPGPGTGTLEDPFPGIVEALADSSCMPGTTVVVLPGEYSPFTVTTNHLVIEAQGGPMETIIDRSAPDPFGVIVQASDVSIEGFWFRGAPDGVLRQGLGVHVGGRAIVRRCIFTDIETAFSNGWDLYVFRSAVVRCHVGYRAAGQDLSGFQDSIFWDVGVVAQGSLTGQPDLSTCFFGDPITFGPDDLHLRRISPCIDAGSGPSDPDGSPADIGPYAYDLNHPLGTSYCFNEANSTGARGRIQLVGTSSLSSLAAGGQLKLRASRCPVGQLGVFVIGEARGESSLMSGGTLSVGPPIGRRGPVVIDGVGVGEVVWLNAANQSGLGAGDLRSAQLWHRDSTPSGTGLSHAVHLMLRP